MVAMVAILATTDDRPATAATRVLRCASRACDHKPLGETRGDTLAVYGGVTVGPVPRGAVAKIQCPRCRRNNIFWL